MDHMDIDQYGNSEGLRDLPYNNALFGLVIQ